KSPPKKTCEITNRTCTSNNYIDPFPAFFMFIEKKSDNKPLFICYTKRFLPAPAPKRATSTEVITRINNGTVQEPVQSYTEPMKNGPTAETKYPKDWAIPDNSEESRLFLARIEMKNKPRAKLPLNGIPIKTR